MIEERSIDGVQKFKGWILKEDTWNGITLDLDYPGVMRTSFSQGQGGGTSFHICCVPHVQWKRRPEVSRPGR